MIVQVYNDGVPRLFTGRGTTMVCEVNADTMNEVEAQLRKLHLRRKGPWAATEWGFEAKFYFRKQSSGNSK